MRKAALLLLALTSLGGCVHKVAQAVYTGPGTGADAYKESPCHVKASLGTSPPQSPCRPVQQRWGQRA